MVFLIPAEFPTNIVAGVCNSDLNDDIILFLGKVI